MLKVIGREESMAEANTSGSANDRSWRSSSIWQVGEILGVFLVGCTVLLSFLGIFGTGRFTSVIGIWIANLTMLSGIYWGLLLRGQNWGHLGLSCHVFRFPSILKTVFQSIPVFIFGVLAFVVGAIVMANIVGVPEAADMSKYDYLRGNLGMTLVALGSVYVVSSFAEEVIYRGFLITRLMEWWGDRRLSLGFPIVLSSLVFGLVHSDWGVAGMVQATCMGVALGISYVVVKRNLWVTILAHAYMDTLLILQMYM